MKPNHELVRGLGPIAAISINVGNIIGTGILKARVMTCNVGTPTRVILVWVAAGLLALAGALTYAELTTMRPHAGAEYVITKDAYGRVWGFLNGWSQFLISRTASAAALAVGFAIFMNDLLRGGLDVVYFTVPIPVFGIEIPFGHIQVVALITLAVTTLINCAAVGATGHVASFVTILKVTVVLGVGIAAFFYQDGTFAHMGMANVGGTCEDVAVTGGGFAGFAAAMLGALWAYDGWNNVSYMAGEVKHPERNLPLALIASMLIIIALYVIVNVSYYYVMNPTDVASISATSSVAAESIGRVLGPVAVTLMAGVMMLSSWGSLRSILGTARIPYAMARDGVFFQSLARISQKTRVPIIALIVQGVWAGVLAVSGKFDQLTDLAIFAFWLFYGMVTASVFVFRRREPDVARPYRTWGYPVVPAVFVLVTIYLIVFTIYNAPFLSFLGLLVIAAGLPVYFYFSKKNPEQR